MAGPKATELLLTVSVLEQSPNTKNLLIIGGSAPMKRSESYISIRCGVPMADFRAYISIYIHIFTAVVLYKISLYIYIYIYNIIDAFTYF